MFSRLLCVAAICFGLAPAAQAAEYAGQRASCATVRYYVAKYSASAAETWARSQGATDADIQAARSCLHRAHFRTAQASRWKAMQ